MRDGDGPRREAGLTGQERMKRVETLTFVLTAAVAGASAGLAEELSVDWKLYGFVSNDTKDPEECYYDAKGIVRGTDSHIRVWTKCLLQKDMDNIDIEKDFEGKILKNAAQKIVHYYVPPIAAIETIDVNQSMIITQYEETANISYIEPRARIFYELNCPEKMLRELSISIRANGKFGSRNEPGKWSYVAPETNGARLLKILCPLR